jgi:predicted ferric reductase
MTTTTHLAPPLVRREPQVFAVARERRAAARRDRLWRDALEASVWLVSVALVAFFLGSGAMVWTIPADGLNALGRFLGIVATVLMLVMVALASRAPFVERAVGHDKALRMHGAMGQPVFFLLLAHAVLVTLGYGMPTGLNLVDQTAWFWSHSRDIALAIVSLVVFVVVAATSIAAARRRWPYETWHAIHLFTYAAVALAVPHELTAGSTFRFNPGARAFLLGLYVVAFGSMLIWRFAVPAYRAIHHRLVVLDVEHEADGSATLTVVGRHLDEWYARPGQFYLWRFYTPDLWLTSHPYSLSAAPDGRSLRITVKPLGDDSTRTTRIKPGTRVSASGPYGRFIHEQRRKRGLVLVGAGVGVTPLRSLLEDRRATDGPCDVILRGSDASAVPLLDEFRELARERGARLHVVLGPRAGGWSTADGPRSLGEVVDNLPDCDVFVCGADAWSRAVIRDAIRCGVERDAIHLDEYAW